MRRALAACVVLSAGFHYAVGPWTLFPQRSLEVRDVDGQLVIPVDLIEGEPEPPPPPPPPPPPAETKPSGEGIAVDAGAPPRRDAGPRDARARDVEQEEAGEADGALAGAQDAAGATGLGDAAVATAEDGGIPGGGPRDAVGMIGAAGNVQAGAQLVVLTVSMAVIRSHPVGSRMGPLLSAIPQWDDFIAGTNIDPVRDADWIMINGPSLIHTDRDAIIVRYSAPDAVVDRAIDHVAHKYDRGGAFDAGVPGVKAMLGHADRAQRVFLRPQSHVLAVVPPDYAHDAAALLRRARIAKTLPHADEAMRLKLVNPHHPLPDIPASVTELRLWIVPRADGGADVYGEGDTADASAAASAVRDLRRFVRDVNSIGVQILTHGLLNGVELAPDGSNVRLHLTATRDQIEVLLAFAAGQLGVNLPPPPDAGP